MPGPRDAQGAKSSGGIPIFRTVDEEAAFWDSHDSAQFEGEFETVSDVGFGRGTEDQSLTILLDGETYARLDRRAQERGTDAASLARDVIWQHVRASG